MRSVEMRRLSALPRSSLITSQSQSIKIEFFHPIITPRARARFYLDQRRHRLKATKGLNSFASFRETAEMSPRRSAKSQTHLREACFVNGPLEPNKGFLVVALKKIGECHSLKMKVSPMLERIELQCLVEASSRTLHFP